MTGLYEYLLKLAATPGSITLAGTLLFAAFILVDAIRALCGKPSLLQERKTKWLPFATVLFFMCLLGIDQLRGNGLV
jgi:hypothetical protein